MDDLFFVAPVILKIEITGKCKLMPVLGRVYFKLSITTGNLVTAISAVIVMITSPKFVDATSIGATETKNVNNKLKFNLVYQFSVLMIYSVVKLSL